MKVLTARGIEPRLAVEEVEAEIAAAAGVGEESTRAGSGGDSSKMGDAPCPGVPPQAATGSRVDPGSPELAGDGGGALGRSGEGARSA